ncbi:MAG: cbb3-type cytochrome c oxidase subunit I [Alphaproteobacteria bacterium]|nr:cbb3-type cytochrome c oxidase subunit I [Alphaproteobacteria bacterium]
MSQKLAPIDNPITTHRQKEVYAWILLALSALALAGIFSILLVVQRTPVLQNILPGHDFFHTALTVHVNLSVLVWMLSITGAMGSLLYPKYLDGLGRYFAVLAGLGALAMALSPFGGSGIPFMNNYVPIFYHPLFIFGLSLFLVSLAGHALVVCFSAKLGKTHETLAFTTGIYSSVFMVIFALVYFVISYYKLKFENASYPDLEHYYNLLFWGGGHILQMAYTQIMSIAWLWILYKVTSQEIRFSRILQLLFIGNALLAILSIPAYLVYPVASSDFQYFFTQHMRYVGGVLPVVITLLYARPLFSLLKKFPFGLTAPALCLAYSLVLFYMGGTLGWLITGANVTIPAHYHGSIIGISIALIGWVQIMLPEIGCAPLEGKMIRWQPHILAIGQILHISGLALSGGYGALRKDPSLIINTKIKICMGIMGLGGLLAIIGGLLFVIPCLLTLMKRSKHYN